MTTLTINDLAVTSALDTVSMRSVRGGMYKFGGYFPAPGFNQSKHDLAFSAEQLTSQTQSNLNATGNNAAFVSDIHSTFTPAQSSTSSINF